VAAEGIMGAATGIASGSAGVLSAGCSFYTFWQYPGCGSLRGDWDVFNGACSGSRSWHSADPHAFRI